MRLMLDQKRGFLSCGRRGMRLRIVPQVHCNVRLLAEERDATDEREGVAS